jgi:hypothetical protein
VVSVVLQGLKVLKLHKKAGHEASFLQVAANRSGGTDSGISPEEEQAHNEQHSHSTSCGNEPKR